MIAAFEARLSGRERLLAPGEIGLVAVCSPTRLQSRIVRSYIRAAFETTPLLKNEIVDEGKESFTLKNGVEIQTLTGDFRTVRGFSLIAAVVDEVCFFGLSEEGKVKSDTELVTALRPGLATTGGRLIAIGSKYTPRGWAYGTWKCCRGNDASKVLVWATVSRRMNPTLAQSIIDDAMAEDPSAARSEYLNEWRTDIAAFVPRELVENLVVPGRLELPYNASLQYAAFADVSGGRSDDAALAIAHREGRVVVLDCLRRYKAPHNPHDVIAQMVATLRAYGLDRATGDAYAAEFTKTTFERTASSTSAARRPPGRRVSPTAGSRSPSRRPSSTPSCSRASTSGEVQLLDNDLLVTQVAGLERRTRSGGRDVIDHPPGGHDDVANVLAGVCDAVMNRRQVAGIVGVDGTGGMNTDASGDWVLPGDPRSPKTNSTAYELAMREFEIEREEHAREQRLFAQPHDDQEPFREWMRQNTNRVL